MIGLAFKAFGAASLVTKLVIGAGILLSVLSIYGVWHHKVWSKGYDSALTDIAKQDKKAIARAVQYRNAVRDCSALGLRWDQTTGKCGGG